MNVMPNALQIYRFPFDYVQDDKPMYLWRKKKDVMLNSWPQMRRFPFDYAQDNKSVNLWRKNRGSKNKLEPQKKLI
jgi:hypothetical protein